MERLDKFLSDSGAGTRSQVKLLLKGGRVTVDGARETDGSRKVDPDRQEVCLDGEKLGGKQRIVLMLNKPAGYVTATWDAREKTVMELLPERYRRGDVSPVGRLDKDTEGLLLLTNDGPLAHQLLAPGKHVDKVYYVEVDGVLDQEDVKAFQAGITLGDGTACLPAELELLPQRDQGLVTLREGKYHQVKRMLASRGKPVVYLKRLSMGPLELDRALPAGRWRMLTPEEKAFLGR